jgi:outer membrane protein
MYNNSLAAGRSQLRSTDEGVSQAISTWRPTVTLTSDAGRQDITSNFQYPLKYHYYDANQDATARVVQPVYQGGLTVASVAQAESAVLAQRASLRATEANVLLAAATAFLDVIRDRQIVQINIENEQNLRQQAESSHDRFREGEISSTDVSQSEARLSQASAQRVLAEGTLKDSQANFVAAVGHVPETLEMSPDVLVTPGRLEDVHAATLSHNPNVLAAKYVFEAAKSGIDVALSSLLPQVQVSAQRFKSWNGSYAGSYQRLDQVMLTVSVPFYQQGAEYSKVRGQKDTAAQHRLEADQAMVDALQAADQAWNSLQTNNRALKFYEEQVTNDEAALAGVVEEEQIGSRTVIEVLNAKQELYNARVSLAQSRHDMMVAALQLRGTIGEITAEALNLPVEVYDPAKHYEDVRDKWIGLGDDPTK